MNDSMQMSERARSSTPETSKAKRHNPYAAVTPTTEGLSPSPKGLTPPQSALGGSFGSPLTPQTSNGSGPAGQWGMPMTPPTPPPAMAHQQAAYQASLKGVPLPLNLDAPAAQPPQPQAQQPAPAAGGPTMLQQLHGAPPQAMAAPMPPQQFYAPQQQPQAQPQHFAMFAPQAGTTMPAPMMAAGAPPQPAGAFMPPAGQPGMFAMPPQGMPAAAPYGAPTAAMPMAHQPGPVAPQQQPHHHGGHHNAPPPQQHGGRGQHNNHGNHHHGSQQAQEGSSGSGANVPTYADLVALKGQLVEHARTASGSSCIQAALKDAGDNRALELIWGELSPALSDLVLDAHGCYVVKSLLDRLPTPELQSILATIAGDDQLGFSICTHSLHTRRVVQHIIENIDGQFLCELMSRRCAEVAMTQQGCIVMQRSMDHAKGADHDALLAAISKHIVGFAKDPFANYVVQHLMEVGEREATSAAIREAVQTRVVELACNKFASNVIEKCLFHVTARVQHEMLTEMYSSGPQCLFNMLQDSFGNYIIQSSIALATFRDVSFIDEKLRPVLVHTPYGHKIEARLDRRLKGKPVTARSPLLPHQGRRAAPRKSENHNAPAATVPEGEVPW